MKRAKSKKKVTRRDHSFSVRLFEPLYTKFKDASKKSGRTLAQEVLFRAEQAINFEKDFTDIDRYRQEHDLLIKMGREAALLHWKIRPVAGRPGWYFQGDNPPKEMVEVNPALYDLIEAVVDRKLKSEP